MWTVQHGPECFEIARMSKFCFWMLEGWLLSGIKSTKSLVRLDSDESQTVGETTGLRPSVSCFRDLLVNNGA